MPNAIRDTIQKYENLNDYTSPVYSAALNSYYSKHLALIQWPPTDTVTCNGVSDLNSQVLTYMWGPAEFNGSGTLTNFDRTSRLHEVKQPVLFIAGREDVVRAETIYKFQKLVKRSEVVIVD